MSNANSSLDMKISRETLRKISKLKRDNYSCLLIILFNCLIVAVSIYVCVVVSYIFYPLAVILIGSVHRVFANLLHETSHNTFAENKILNHIGGTYLSSYLVFHMAVPYKCSHMKHHSHLGDRQEDPDFEFHISCGLYDNSQPVHWFIIKNILLSMIGYRSIQYIKYIFKDRIFFDMTGQSDKTKREAVRERWAFFVYWAVLASLIVYFGVITEFILFWLVPMFTAGITIGWLAELAEHYPLPELEKESLFLTRNRNGTWLENFIIGRHGDRYHLIHHLAPNIPCYKYKAAHQALLNEEAYRNWNDMCGGIFTWRNDKEESLISFIIKYRDWQKTNPDSESFCTYLIQKQAS
ncbi:fatty acid desaturase [Pseudoalteromonas sp. A22]|uniref:Fatty acid desaturase family protein n=1 Tax=Pseudoalteromonas maricaloris TaxID=184924 RepID=A0A8I2H8H8_9GAMM|nr:MULTISPECIES: fatty acid desaturase family protein [Pseudoalteromonas]NLR20850.1 fatty acid desaturase family protein [Pseudoalteromonas maricaloris]QUI61480.1 fatty acid desaturase [Pseudoalteromonas sp. A22]RZG12160.1 fatty acid desaturase [Pseudoalteromonas sp. CO342X]USE71041.1 fatty acid desaturase [Pseudoalteromonas flavipulchra]WOX30907.1 fatty acid desaturase family protein [Pseudoalteromonas maricaloris]